MDTISIPQENLSHADNPVTKINWAQIWSLAGLNAAVVISWIAYHNYQPKVVEGFGLKELSYFLVVAQALILVVIPPIAGIIGDHMIKKNGKRFVVFTVGAGATAMIFMAVASLVQIGPTPEVKMVLPVMIALWLISMNIFHSPANSMLDLFAPTSELPKVMVIITMTTELLYALEPIVIILVDFLGGTLTFVTGGVLLIVSGYFFLRTTKNISNEAFSKSHSSSNVRENNFFPVIVVGITFGVITAFIMDYLPSILSTKLPSYDTMVFGGNHFSSIILGVAALLAFPVSKLIAEFGLVRSIVIGFIVASISILIILFAKNQILTIMICFLLASAYSLISVAAFPFTLKNLSARNITFGVGLFYGSLELASGLFNILLFK